MNTSKTILIMEKILKTKIYVEEIDVEIEEIIKFEDKQ